MTSIEWVKNADGSQGLTWNPIRGCTRVSPGCGGPGPHGGCYAEGIAARFSGPGQPYEGLAVMKGGKPRWTGKLAFVESALMLPLRRKKPTTWFVNSMSDLFHESVPDAWIDRVFAVMTLCPQHTFQVLTKRSARMRAYMARLDAVEDTAWLQDPRRPNCAKQVRWCLEAYTAQTAGMPFQEHLQQAWPLPNVWLGVSAEDQRRADERVPDLLATPAAVRFVSAEPLLGPIDFTRISLGMKPGYVLGEDGQPDRPEMFKVVRDALMDTGGDFERLDWIIVGGESGPSARPMHPAWARSIRDQCAAAGVAYHFKQHGAWAAIDQSAGADEAGWQGRGDWMILSADGDLDIPDDRWPDEAAGEVAVVRVGKKAAGRLLDGVEWNQMPEVSR